MYALIAGQGSLPCHIIDELIRKNISFVCVQMNEAKNPLLEKYELITAHFSIVQTSSIINFLKEHGVTHIIFAGSIQRPNIFALQFDEMGKSLIKKIGFNLLKGDDGLLSSVIKFMEEQGFTVISAKEILQDLTVSPGVLTYKKPTKMDDEDISFGIKILEHLSILDIGQAVIVERGLVLGIEAIEGTKCLIERILNFKRTSDAGVLIKMMKKNQSTKIDLPTIGIETIEQCYQSGLSGIAFDHYGTQVIDPQKVIDLANERNIFLKSL